jgi:SAM-dependent methyltransferase
VHDPAEAWLGALERRHLASLTFQEVRRALQALSSLYVERRGRLATGAALEGAGKRAAFALYYGPQHFFLVREVVRALGAAAPAPERILDLGCGTGVAGAAWALESHLGTFVEGVDRSAWALQEARWTYAQLRLRGRTLRGEAASAPSPKPPAGVIAAFTVNELSDEARDALLVRLLDAARTGVRVLVVEPIARRSFPWWTEWSRAFVAAGGRDDEWRFPATLPDRVRLLGKAAGLDPRELLGRSLWLG